MISFISYNLYALMSNPLYRSILICVPDYAVWISHQFLNQFQIRY